MMGKKRTPVAVAATEALADDQAMIPTSETTGDNQTQARSKWRERYKVHAAADVFPMMTDAELAALGKDIKENGLKHPIILNGPVKAYGRSENLLLIDGRNRLEAMERAGIPFARGGYSAETIWGGGDAVADIISLNIHRRHLTKQQQADLIVAAIKAGEKLPERQAVSKGGRGKVNPIKQKAIAIAKDQGIGKDTVERSLAKAEGRKPKDNSRSAVQTRMGPSTVEGWRSGYINACKVGCADLDAEQEIIIDALRAIAEAR